MDSLQRPGRVFISYSHRDRRYLDRLHTHLKPYERDGLVDYWDDTNIAAGMQWKEAIQRAIASAKVALLLISADFLASDFIASRELPPLLAAAQASGTRILPIIVGACNFDDSGLSRFQAINVPSRPLSGMSMHRRDQVWAQAARIIKETLSGGEQQRDAKAEFRDQQHVLDIRRDNALGNADDHGEIAGATTRHNSAVPGASTHPEGDEKAVRSSASVASTTVEQSSGPAPIELQQRPSSPVTALPAKRDIRSLEIATETKADDADAWLDLADGYSELGRDEEALAAVGKALEIYPDSALAWCTKGDLHLTLRQRDDALAAYEQALYIDPDEPWALLNKGIILFYLGRDKGALSALERILELEPENADAWYYKGQVLEDLGADDEALEAYDRAFEFDRTYSRAMRKKGELLARIYR